MNNDLNTIWCASCGVEITWSPLIVKGFYYCCQECFLGNKCDCSERAFICDEERSSPYPAPG